MTDRELLEAAAKAIGMALDPIDSAHEPDMWMCWNPLTDDGDAFRLAVEMTLMTEVMDDRTVVWVADTKKWFASDHTEMHGDDPYAATRRAIVTVVALAPLPKPHEVGP